MQGLPCYIFARRTSSYRQHPRATKQMNVLNPHQRGKKCFVLFFCFTFNQIKSLHHNLFYFVRSVCMTARSLAVEIDIFCKGKGVDWNASTNFQRHYKETYWIWASALERMVRMKEAVSLGLKVDGTIRYSPGSNMTSSITSRALT